jgi:hypothetical protein
MRGCLVPFGHGCDVRRIRVDHYRVKHPLLCATLSAACKIEKSRYLPPELVPARHDKRNLCRCYETRESGRLKRFVVVCVWVCWLSVAIHAADSTRVTSPEITPIADSTRAVPTDSTAKTDSAAILAPPPKVIKPFRKLTPQLDSLLTLLFGSRGNAAVAFDLPQASSRFDYDPISSVCHHRNGESSKASIPPG